MVKELIPIIDIFAGPGGLGEGFSSFEEAKGRIPFKIKLSIEKDEHAHTTLELRAFFRQFPKGKAPGEYYDYLQGLVQQAAFQICWPDTVPRPALENPVVARECRRVLASAFFIGICQTIDF